MYNYLILALVFSSLILVNVIPAYAQTDTWHDSTLNHRQQITINQSQNFRKHKSN